MVDNCIMLDDGSKYTVIDKDTVNGVAYAYLLSQDNDSIFFFKRYKEENGSVILSAIETDEEFDNVVNYFGNKFKKMLENESVN